MSLCGRSRPWHLGLALPLPCAGPCWPPHTTPTWPQKRMMSSWLARSSTWPVGLPGLITTMARTCCPCRLASPTWFERGARAGVWGEAHVSPTEEHRWRAAERAEQAPGAGQVP